MEMKIGNQNEIFEFMRNKVSEICKHYHADIAIDIESILTRKYEEPHKPLEFVWEIGECGTHLIWSDDTRNYLDAVRINYPEPQNKYYHLLIEKEGNV